MPSRSRINVRLLARAFYVIGFLLVVVFVIDVAYYANTYGESGPGAKLMSDRNLLIVVFSMGLVVDIINNLFAKYPYAFFKRSEYELCGAYKYSTCTRCNEDYAELVEKKVIKDGLEFAGLIENPYDSAMEVYVRRYGLFPQTVLLIETEVFTEELLLEHMSLLEKFMTEYTGSPRLNWATRMRTVVIVDRMSFPMQLLLSVKSSYTIKVFTMPWFMTITEEVYAIVKEESNVYVKAKTDYLMSDVRKKWLMEYIISPEEELKHVWKDIQWKDIMHEFPRYRDFPLVVLKALNMWKGGYEEHQVEVEESPDLDKPHLTG
jgi:hypothetical protein